MRVRRPKTKTKRCAHCRRRRLARFIEWHPGIMEWQCSSFSDCNEAMEANCKAIHPRTSRVCGDFRKFQKPKKLVWNQVACNWLCMPRCVKWGGHW